MSTQRSSVVRRSTLPPRAWLRAALLALATVVVAGAWPGAAPPLRAQQPPQAAASQSLTAVMEFREVGQLLDEIESASPPLAAYPQLLRLDDYSEHLPAEHYDQAVDSLAARDDLDPLVRAQLVWRAADLDNRRGRTDEAEAGIAGLGMLTRWQVVGPFEDDGLFTRHAPEEGIDPDASLDGMFEGLRWRALESQGRLGYVRLGAAVAPTTDTTSYLATVVESDSDREAVLWLGVDGAYRVWHGTRLLGERREDLGGHLDRDGWRVRLREGTNVFVVKIANTTGNAGLYARLTDDALAPLALPHGQSAPRIDGALDNEVTLLAALPSQKKKGQDDALPSRIAGPLERLDVWLAALEERAEDAADDDDIEAPEPTEMARAMAWVAFARDRLASVDGQRAGQELMRRALSLAPTDRRVVELAVLALEEPWQRREALDGALEAHPGDPLLSTLQVQELLRGSAFDLADAVQDTLESLERKEPDSPTVSLLRGEWMASQGLTESAWTVASETAQRWPTVPAVLDDLQWRSLSSNRHATRLSALEQLVALRNDVDAYRDEIASLHMQRGEVDAAVEVLTEGLAIRPDAEFLARRRIDILTTQGRTDEARQAWSALVTHVPTSANLHQQHGDWLLAQGDQAGALEAWRTSLALAAQNESLRQMVRYLDPDTEGFEQPWVVANLADVPPVLDDGSDYGVALDQKIVLVHPNGLSSTYVQTVYDVFNDNGASKMRHIPLFYTPEEEILEVDMVRVVKPDGSVRDVYESQEYSVADESIRMYYDYRNMVIQVSDLAPGDRLEVRYRKSQTTQTNYFDNHFGDVWYLQSDVPRKHVRYVLIAPASREVNIRLPEKDGFAVEHTTTQDGDRMVHVLEHEDIPKLETEPMMPGRTDVAPYAVISTFAGWGEVARWYWELARDQWIVDSEIRAVVEQLSDGVDDRRELVSRIHNYVVKNTRYVALEFGVHGYKPYRTTVCFRRRFGDCKDKASLIKVMLEEAGIPADIVLVRTRRNGRIDTDPATLTIFDHAIAYVPEFDLFLDGTAEFSGTEELPAMDQGVTVLVVKDEGEFELRETPVLPASASRIENRYEVELSMGSARIEGRGVATGEFAPGYRQRYESTEKRRDLFETEMAAEYPGASVESLEFEAVEDLERPVVFDFTATVDSLLRPSGDVLLLLPHGHKADLAPRLAPSSSREHDLMLSFAFEFENAFDYELPDGYALAEVPEPVVLDTPYGRFELDISDGGDGVVRVSSFIQLTQARVPAEDYAAFRDFVISVDRALNTPLRIVPAVSSAR